MWSIKYQLNECKECGRNLQPHRAFGLCKTCYLRKRGYDWAKAYQKTNRKRLSEYQKRWASENRERVILSKKKYRLAHKYQNRIDLKKWRRNHRAQKCAICEETRVVDWAHILPARDGWRAVKSNLVELCPTHHRCYDNNLLTQTEIEILDTIYLYLRALS